MAYLHLKVQLSRKYPLKDVHQASTKASHIMYSHLVSTQLEMSVTWSCTNKGFLQEEATSREFGIVSTRSPFR